MKKILISLLAVSSSFNLYAVKEPLKEVVQVIDLKGMNQKQIFDSSKIWMAKTFKSSNAVIQYEDVTTGTIIGKGNMRYPCKGTWNCLANADNLVLFTVKIDTKDEKARVTFNDLLIKTKAKVINGIVSNSMEFEIYVDKDKENVESGLKDIISEYKNDIESNQSDSEW